MKSTYLALIVVIYFAATVTSECDVKGADECRNELVDRLSNSGSHKLKLCTANMYYLSCLSIVGCSNDPTYMPMKMEATNNMDTLCNSGETLIVTLGFTILLAVIAVFFE